jgi:hypothetical protein
VEYRQPAGRQTAVSAGWLNEGHLPYNHRDGLTLQLWRSVPGLGDRVTVGAGPYLWCDTEIAPDDLSSENTHGIGAILSAETVWRASDMWQWQLRGNFTISPSGFDTASVLLGLGYQLAAEPRLPSWMRGPTDKRRTTEGAELTVSGGLAVQNSVEAHSWGARALEYRRGVGRHADWTVGLLDEAGGHSTRHQGVTSELWAVRSFPDERWTLGAGAGAYIPIDSQDVAGMDHPASVLGMVSATASRRLGARWLARATWHRLITTDSSDADVLLFGLGYRL